MKNEIQRIIDFNIIAGNTCEYRQLSELDLSFNLIDEEYFELSEALDNNDRVETVDALCDLIVVAVGALHSMGVDPEEALKRVNDSNMSKYCKDETAARRSVEAYQHNKEYAEVFYEKVGVDKPKILKGIHYKEPVIGDLALLRTTSN